MRSRTLHITLLFALAVALNSCGDKGRVLPSLRETYSHTDTKPFGGAIAYRQLEAMFRDESIRIKKRPFDRTYNELSYLDTNSLYVCITPNLFLNSAEADAMLEYVNAGNDLFISAGYIDEMLLSKTGLRMVKYMDPYNYYDSMRPVNTETVLPLPGKYGYYYLPFRNYFAWKPDDFTRTLGLNSDGNPNSVVFFHGKGKLFLHCDPRAFSNYFLLKENNYEYMRHALSFSSSEPYHLYWDDYYNKVGYRRDTNSESDPNFSSLKEIMKHPPLAAAFWLSLLLLLLYILFGAKRLQRVIRERKPNVNTTLTYTETIGRLYLQKRDNKNIADKMITYFNEYIRNKYFITGNAGDTEFITALSRKSGLPRNQVEILYHTIESAQRTDVMDDFQLMSLNEQIEKFYKKRN